MMQYEWLPWIINLHLLTILPCVFVIVVIALVMLVSRSPRIAYVISPLYAMTWCSICLLLLAIAILTIHKMTEARYTRLGAQEAVLDGDLDDLIHAYYKGCVCTEPFTLALAARGGHLQIVRYLRENARCDWNEIACEYASAGGHTETLQYLLDNGCPSNERTCEAAAENGHLDCLVVAHEHGCRWNARTATKAFKNMHHRCFKYAVENGCPYPQVYEDAALILQAWWRDRMYRYGSSFVNMVVKPRFEYNLSLMSL